MPISYVVVMLIMSSVTNYCTEQRLQTKMVSSEHKMYRNFAGKNLQVI